MTGCTLGGCASFNGVDLVSGKISSDAEEMLWDPHLLSNSYKK